MKTLTISGYPNWKKNSPNNIYKISQVIITISFLDPDLLREPRLPLSRRSFPTRPHSPPVSLTKVQSNSPFTIYDDFDSEAWLRTTCLTGWSNRHHLRSTRTQGDLDAPAGIWSNDHFASFSTPSLNIDLRVAENKKEMKMAVALQAGKVKKKIGK